MARGAIQRTLRETNTAVEGLSGMVFFIQEKLVPGDGYIYSSNETYCNDSLVGWARRYLKRRGWMDLEVSSRSS